MILRAFETVGAVEVPSILFKGVDGVKMNLTVLVLKMYNQAACTFTLDRYYKHAFYTVFRTPR